MPEEVEGRYEGKDGRSARVERVVEEAQGVVGKREVAKAEEERMQRSSVRGKFAFRMFLRPVSPYASQNASIQSSSGQCQPGAVGTDFARAARPGFAFGAHDDRYTQSSRSHHRVIHMS